MDETALTEVSAGPAHDSLRRDRESSPTISAAVCSIPHVASQIEHAILVLALRCQDRRTPETLRIRNESGLISWELRARDIKKGAEPGEEARRHAVCNCPVSHPGGVVFLALRRSRAADRWSAGPSSRRTVYQYDLRSSVRWRTLRRANQFAARFNTVIAAITQFADRLCYVRWRTAVRTACAYPCF